MAAPDIAVTRTIKVGEPPEAAMQRFLAEFSPWFARGKWYVTAQTSMSVTHGRRMFHVWQIVVAILLFPIGLLALLAERHSVAITASFAPLGETATSISFTGNVPPKLAGQLADQLDRFDPESPG